MIYKEFDLPDDHPLITSLNEMLNWTKISDAADRVSGALEIVDDMSEEALNKRINGETVNKCRMSRFDHNKEFNFDDVQKYSAEVYEEQTGLNDYILYPVAKTVYPAGGGHLGWHIDSEGGRIYSTYTEGESFFRYRDPITKEVITSYDKPNKWTFRIFTFDENNPLWHCVYAKDQRISIGYRFLHISSLS